MRDVQIEPHEHLQVLHASLAVCALQQHRADAAICHCTQLSPVRSSLREPMSTRSTQGTQRRGSLVTAMHTEHVISQSLVPKTVTPRVLLHTVLRSCAMLPSHRTCMSPRSLCSPHGGPITAEGSSAAAGFAYARALCAACAEVPRRSLRFPRRLHTLIGALPTPHLNSDACVTPAVLHCAAPMIARQSWHTAPLPACCATCRLVHQAF